MFKENIIPNVNLQLQVQNAQYYAPSTIETCTFFFTGFESASLQYKAKRKSEQIIVNCSILKFKLAKVAVVPTIN